jgi:TolB protein
MKWCLILLAVWLGRASADPLTIVITQGTEGALPIAVVPFGWSGAGAPPQDLAAIVGADLARSGRFKVLDRSDMLSHPETAADVDFRDWRVLGMQDMVVGQLQPQGAGAYQARFQLLDVYRGQPITGYALPSAARDLRATAHRIADMIYKALTGEPGAFDTRIAYVSSTRGAKGKSQVTLEVSDADGYNPQTIVTSAEPLMSPAWSPDGKRLAYVSFEQGRPAIYIQDVLTGRRERVSAYPGINGAPAWSPDGRQLAMALSKDGNPDIYVMDLASRALRRVTDDLAIDTEPDWSPDGRSLVFTSDRGGKPQLYLVPAGGGQARRLTYDGDYNARGVFSPDGRSIAMVHGNGGDYRIAVMDVQSGALRVLTKGRLDESPGFAPNGSMILYAANSGGSAHLEAVSIDGKVQQALRIDSGAVREPAWSP